MAACATILACDHLNEKILDVLDDARRKPALWRYGYNTVRPHSSPRNQAPIEARRTLLQFEDSGPARLPTTTRQLPLANPQTLVMIEGRKGGGPPAR